MRYPGSPRIAPLIAALLLAAGSPATLVGGAARAEEYRGQRGYVFLARRAYPLAVRWFETAHQARPEMAGPLAGMALAECRLGRDADSRDHLAAARDRDPADPLVRAAEACWQIREDRLSEAEETLAAAHDGSQLPFHGREHARFLLHQGQFADAAALLREMRAAGSQERTVAMLLAGALLGLGEPEESLSLAEEQLDAAPRSDQAVAVLLLHELAGGPPGPERIPDQPRMITWSGGNEVVLLRAESLRRRGLLDAAETEAGRRKVDPDDPLSRSMLARLAVDLGDLDEAGELAADAARRWPLHPSVMLTEARVAAAQGRPDAAQAALRDARAAGVPPWDVAFAGEVEERLRP